MCMQRNQRYHNTPEGRRVMNCARPGIEHTVVCWEVFRKRLEECACPRCGRHNDYVEDGSRTSLPSEIESKDIQTMLGYFCCDCVSKLKQNIEFFVETIDGNLVNFSYAALKEKGLDFEEIWDDTTTGNITFNSSNLAIGRVTDVMANGSCGIAQDLRGCLVLSTLVVDYVHINPTPDGRIGRLLIHDPNDPRLLLIALTETGNRVWVLDDGLFIVREEQGKGEGATRILNALRAMRVLLNLQKRYMENEPVAERVLRLIESALNQWHAENKIYTPNIEEILFRSLNEDYRSRLTEQDREILTEHRDELATAWAIYFGITYADVAAGARALQRMMGVSVRLRGTIREVDGMRILETRIDDAVQDEEGNRSESD